MNKMSDKHSNWQEYQDTVMGRLAYLEDDKAELKSLTGKDIGKTTTNIMATIPSKYDEFKSITAFMISTWVIDKNKEMKNE